MNPVPKRKTPPVAQKVNAKIVKRETPPVAQKVDAKIVRIAKIKLVKVEFKLVKPIILKSMNWKTITAATPDDGSFEWKIPKKLI